MLPAVTVLFSPATQKAWMLLLEGPYRQGTNGTEKSSIVAARPALDVKKSGPNAGLEIPYDPALIIRAQSLLLEDADKLSASRPYRFDLVDVQRQMMTNLGQLIHRKAAERSGVKTGRLLHFIRDVFSECLPIWIPCCVHEANIVSTDG